MKAIKTILVMMMVTILSCANAQIITKENGRFGLLYNSGKVIFKNEYDKISTYWDEDLYLVEKAGKKQFYNIKDTVLYPFVFDDVKSNYGVLVVRNENAYGFIKLTGRRNANGATAIAPTWSSLTVLNDGSYICAQKGSRFGVISAFDTSLVLVPFEQKQPIEYNTVDGFYCNLESGKIALLRYDEESKTWKNLVLAGYPTYVNDAIIVEHLYTVGNREYMLKNSYRSRSVYDKELPSVIRIYSNESGKLLSTFKTGEGEQMVFSEETQCVEVLKKEQKGSTVSLYNPITKAQVCSVKLNKNEEYYSVRASNGPVYVKKSKSILFGEKITRLGELEGYTYTAYAEPKVWRNRDLGIGGGGGGGDCGICKFLFIGWGN